MGDGSGKVRVRNLGCVFTFIEKENNPIPSRFGKPASSRSLPEGDAVFLMRELEPMVWRKKSLFSLGQ